MASNNLAPQVVALIFDLTTTKPWKENDIPQLNIQTGFKLPIFTIYLELEIIDSKIAS